MAEELNFMRVTESPSSVFYRFYSAYEKGFIGIYARDALLILATLQAIEPQVRQDANPERNQTQPPTNGAHPQDAEETL